MFEEVDDKEQQRVSTIRVVSEKGVNQRRVVKVRRLVPR